jgi:uncharacterized protein YggE
MQFQQPVATPSGITVFGSAIVRTIPDVAVINFSVSEVRPHPKEAFQAIREAAQRVQAFLSTAQVKEAGSSHVGMKEAYIYQNNDRKLEGYRATVQFQVTLSDLNRLEDILTGVVDAGTNTSISVDYQSSRMKEIRAEARTQAFAAAREKAEIYCKAAEVELGDVIHIEDESRDYLQESEGVAFVKIASEQRPAFDPTSITVTGSVLVTFKFRER